MTSNLVIYHNHCADGRFAAAVTMLGIERRGLGRVALYAANYNEPPPNVRGFDHVYIVDFSYPPSTMATLAQETHGNLTVIDHHVTAKEALMEGPTWAEPAASLKNCSIVFDMHESGASLAWRYFFPGIYAPGVVAYIRDRDLWKFELPNSHEVTAALNVLAPTVEDAYALVAAGDDGTQFFAPGDLLLKQWRKRVAAEASGAVRVSCYAGDVACIAYVVNAPHAYASDVSQFIFDETTDADIVLTWNLRRGKASAGVSMRSRGDIDVSALAKLRGGGGHHNAAGCEFDDVTELPRVMQSKILHWSGNRL